MKKALLICLVFSLDAFAKDVTPKSFGVQYLDKSITGQPFINFNITINASDIKPGNFSTIAATIVSAKDSRVVIAPTWVVYRKVKATTIVGSEVFPFSYDGVVALQIIKALRTSKIIMSADNGVEFSINLADLCTSSPNAFLNLAGRAGCTVDEKAIDTLIREMTNITPSQPTSCNEEKSLKGVINLACSDETLRKKIESQFNCLFTCQ